MPRTETISRRLYQFHELSDNAKDKARQWYREASQYDVWWDAVYEDAEQCASILGIEIAARDQKCILTRRDHTSKEWIDRSQAIYFRGFSSQGDGACFEGSYAYAKGAAKAIRQHAPQDIELHRIADELQALQSANFYRLTATVKQSGHYSHSGCMTVSVEESHTGNLAPAATEESVTQLMRDFADWIYKALETENDWLYADAQVDESILANEYEFTEEGERA